MPNDTFLPDLTRTSFRPLERFAERFADDVAAPPVIPCEWMFMGLQMGKPRISLYKHKDSRRYLNLTSRGRIAHYVPPLDIDDETDGGHYVISSRSVYADLTALELHEFGGCWDREHYCDECKLLLDRRRAARHLRAV